MNKKVIKEYVQDFDFHNMDLSAVISMLSIKHMDLDGKGYLRIYLEYASHEDYDLFLDRWESDDEFNARVWREKTRKANMVATAKQFQASQTIATEKSERAELKRLQEKYK